MTTHTATIPWQRPRPRAEFGVGLVCMPFFLAVRPSIQLGVLHAVCDAAGFAVESHHLNVDLAARISPAAYDGLCNHRRRMTGEWLFGHAAFGDASASEEEFFRAFPEEVRWLSDEAKLNADFLVELRRSVLPDFIDECAASVPWGQYAVVGFSSTFQQNVASLALAQRIKQRYPRTVIVFGGANFEGEMGSEYVRAFPFIDFAVVGEGDIAFPRLLAALAEGENGRGLPGVVRRTPDGVEAADQAPPTEQLDALPTPNYDEYFARAERLGLLREPGYVWSIPFESSRGCWWGAKHHCTFCGLNGLGMGFRVKRPGKVLDELQTLARKHRITFFEATDNIMDLKYIEDFFGGIREAKLDYEFFYEVKSNLTRAQIRTLHQGGVRWVQPGIESLSSHVLQLMRKGATMLQNVRFLKWARYYRIRTSWNLLWGFPGETAEDYARELETLKLITHLEPPAGCGRIWLERFSPYFFERATSVRARRPESSYRFAYPGHLDLDKAAYFFEYEMDDTLPEDVHRQTGDWVTQWRRAWAAEPRDALTYRRTSDSVFIDDGRMTTAHGTHAFSGPLALAYEFCSETMRTAGETTHHLETQGYAYPVTGVDEALREFCRLGLALAENGRFLSLALPVNVNW